MNKKIYKTPVYTVAFIHIEECIANGSPGIINVGGLNNEPNVENPEEDSGIFDIEFN